MLYACKGVHTLFTSQSERDTEIQRERERGGERKREKEGVREGEKEIERGR